MSISESLQSYFESDPAVDMAFLFGSVAKGTATRRSDVDVAVRFAGASGAEKPLRLMGELERLLQKDVDVIDLSSAPASLAWTAIRGTRLLVRNEASYINYMLEVSREAEDFGRYALDLWDLRRSRRAHREATAHEH